MSSTKKIVVVGAGASARCVIKNLRAANEGDPMHITVVQPNDFASMPFYQTLVLTKRDTFAENSTFVEIDGSSTTIYGVAVGCSDGTVAVQPLDKSKPVQNIDFDILVCATGFAMPVICETPGQTKDERKAEIDRYSNALLSGKNVVIAGGGTVGIELAADLLETLPEGSRNGKVTLVCSSDHLLADQSPNYGRRCKEVLEEFGCDFIFNDRVSSHTDSMVSEGKPIELTLKSGKNLDCHVYVAAYGRGANTDWLTKPAAGKDPLPAQLLNEKRQVIVDEYMQAAAYDKLYAMAATSNRQEISIFMNVDTQAQTVAKNIIKPKSAKQGDGSQHVMYQIVGHDTFGFFVPESWPMPSFVTTVCCHWCGFPCNMIFPCCWPCPLVLGYCCGPPEGKGLTDAMRISKRMKMAARNSGYYVKGKIGYGEEMERS
ncbi:unnamed protein product [Cylindrotheca closterium]|uniref:FAD/NAD(P)-binding domain-containing protein n=1 Tax=Cylindrotheca closterium TaxID=2856 RepID=A0AAD2FLH7_9STRA|nr:unnamed protein product [Cylindrotheca closterium]